MDTLPANQSKSLSNVSPNRKEKSRESLVYLTTCMIGHLVEVHLKNGSVYSGIFHAADMEKDFGIVLKMASLIKDSTLRGHKSRSEFFRKPPLKTFIVPADELVQVVAENLSVQSEKPVELLTDSSISKSLRVDLEREAGRAVDVFDDSGFTEEDDKLLDTCNDQTFGGSSSSSFQKSASSSGKGYEDVVGDSQSSRNNTNVDQSCSDDPRDLLSEQRSKDFPVPGCSISESELGEQRKSNNPEIPHNSRSAEASVSGHGVFREGAKVSGGGTSASKIVAEREGQGSKVSGKTKSESSFGQSDSRSSESLPAPSTPSRPGLPPSSIGSLSSSEKPTLNPDAKFEAGMDTLPDPQSKSSSNVSPHRREKSRDSLVYLTTCMIGHHVEVHLNDGSVYSGIFHAADMEKDFGIVLKMASLIKESTLRGQKSRSEFFRKPPLKTFIVPADELVQVVAENLPVSSDGMLNAVQSEKPVEMLTDSSISKSCNVNQGRELIPWEPDGNVPRGLENVFDDTSKRRWNQFEANELLFGIKSTFDEKLYTTPLPRSTQTSEVEEKAQKIATEIEDEIIRDVHVAKERGLQLDEKSDIDEETKYSAVRRVDELDDSGFNEEDDKLLDTFNDQTFGGSSTSSVQKSVSSSGKGYEDGDSQPSRNNTNVDQSCSISGDDARHFPSEQRSKDFPAPGSSISESQLGERRKNNSPEVPHSSRSAGESVSGHGDIKEDATLGGGGTSASQISKQFEAAVDTLPAPLSKASSNVSPRRREKSLDSLVYLTTCMIGHLVEVHLKNGSVYSGIFHAADLEKDFGIVLKMASLIKDSTLRRHKSRSEFFRKPPIKTFIVPADELVQVVTENLPVSSDGTLNTVQSEKPVELFTDSSISKSRRVDQDREAGRAVDVFDDSGFTEEDDKLLDTCNDQTFGGSSSFSVQKPASSTGKDYEDVVGDSEPSRNNTNVDQSCSDDPRHIPSEQRSKDFPVPGSSISESQLGERRKNNGPEVSHNSRSAGESVSEHGDIQEGANFSGGGTSASQTVAEGERQGSKVSVKTKSESSFRQSDSRSSESLPAPSTPSRPGLPPSSSIGSLSSSEKSTLNPDAKFKQSEAAMDTLPVPQSNGSPHRREKSRDSLVYLTTCMIGHLVEVHLKNGSVYSGIFHAADMEKDFGIVLKMASLIKDSTLRGHKSRSEFFRKPPFKTFIVPADELVQVVAEDLSVSSDGTLNTVQSEKSVVLLTDSSSVQKPASSTGKDYEDVVGDSQPSRNNTNVDQSCSDDPRHIPSEQRSKDSHVPGSSISESQLGERRKNNGPEVSHNSRSAEESVSGHGGNQDTDIKEGAQFSGGGTSALKIVAERERQGSHVSGKTKSRSSERRTALPTPSRPGLPPSSSIGSLSSSEKFTFDPDAKESNPSQPPASVQAQSPTEYSSFYCPAAPTQQMPVQAQSPIAYGSFHYPSVPIPQMPVQAQFPTADGSFYCPAVPNPQAQFPTADGSFYYTAAPVQQTPGGYEIQPQYYEPHMFYHQYYGQHYGEPGYPQYAQAQIQPQYYEQHMFYHQYYGQHYGEPGYPQYAQAQIQPQYYEQHMFYHQYYGQHYGEPGYPQYAQAQYPQQQQMMMPPRPQMMMGQPPRPPPPYQLPKNPYNERREK